MSNGRHDFAGNLSSNSTDDTSSNDQALALIRDGSNFLDKGRPEHIAELEKKLKENGAGSDLDFLSTFVQDKLEDQNLISSLAQCRSLDTGAEIKLSISDDVKSFGDFFCRLNLKNFFGDSFSFQ